MFPSTQVTFPYSTEPVRAVVVALQTHDSGLDIVSDITPFHPVSHIWPDQPADKGELWVNGHAFSVIDCLTGVIEQASGELYVDNAIPVKRGEPGWSFVVVHRIAQKEAPVTCGDAVILQVDREYQHSLSLAHTAEHLVSMALNQAIEELGLWRKQADRKDPLGHYHFHNYAQEKSQIMPYEARVFYRLGKTLRKRGLNTDELLAQMETVIAHTNARLAQWVAGAGAIKMVCEGTTLTDSRYWQCHLQRDQVATMPCGGTHAQNLNEYKTIEARMIPHDSLHFEIQTHICVN